MMAGGIMRTYKSSSQRLNFLLAISILFFCLTLSSCFVERGGLAPERTTRPSSPVGEEGPPGSWSADAFPGFACPADNITLEWDVGDPFCGAAGPLCQTLTVTDNLGLLTPPITSRDLTGTHVNGSVSSLGSSWSGANPVFTFSVAHDDPSDPGWVDASSEVVIVQNPPVVPIARNFAVTSVCEPVSGRWSLTLFRLDMGDQDFIDATKGLGACVRITSVCYMPSSSDSLRYNPIIASLVGGAMPAVTLALGECVDGLSFRPDLEYQVQPDPSVILLDRLGGSCVEGRMDNPMTEPPFIELQFTLGCDTTLDECGN
jgi:hypothetical protein